jgi:hypothetical protein
MDADWMENGLKITFDPDALKGLSQAFFTWGWMVALGLVALAAILRMVGFRIKKARAYMKEHPGLLGKMVYGVTIASIVLGTGAFFLNTTLQAREVALNDDLPGAWRVLYDNLEDMAVEEARLMTLSVFLENADDTVPQLGLDGFTRILNQAIPQSVSPQQAGEVQRITDLLKKFVRIAPLVVQEVP